MPAIQIIHFGISRTRAICGEIGATMTDDRDHVTCKLCTGALGVTTLVSKAAPAPAPILSPVALPIEVVPVEPASVEPTPVIQEPNENTQAESPEGMNNDERQQHFE